MSNDPNDPLSSYKFIKELRAGGEGKAILLERDYKEYVCKQRIFNSLNEANAGLKEAYALARIVNDNIVRFEDIFIQAKNEVIYLYIIMEYLESGDLLDFLSELSDNAHPDQISDLSSQSSSDSLSEMSSDVEHTRSESNESRKSSGSSTPQQQQPPPCKIFKSKCIIKMTKEFTKSIIHSFKDKDGSSKDLGANIPVLSSNNLMATLEKQNSQSSLTFHMEETVQSNQVKGEANSTYLIEQAQLLEWMLQLSYGVQALHNAHLIHRDLKSENIFISKSNKLKIGDFGLAINSRTPTIKGAVGTYIYSPPEVLENKPYDKSADIFSLGCIFYELITLKVLLKYQMYFGEELIQDKFCSMKFLSSFPHKYYKLGPLVLKMLDRNPTLRPSIDYIIEKLEGLSNSGGITKQPSFSSLSTRSIDNTQFKGIRKQVEMDQVPDCAKIMASAFLNDPRFTALFPPTEKDSLKSLEVLFRFTLKKIKKNGGTIWGYYGLDQKPVSVAVWFNPDLKKKIKFSDALAGGLAFLTKFGLKKTHQGSSLFHFLDNVLTGEQSKERHWFLTNVATLDCFQNQGIGSYLLEPVLEWSDHSQVPIKTLTFSKKTFPYFNRLGFEVDQDISTNLPKGVSGAWVMRRAPRSLTVKNTVNLAASVSNANSLF